jgi:hypothetical protein
VHVRGTVLGFPARLGRRHVVLLGRVGSSTSIVALRLGHGGEVGLLLLLGLDALGAAIVLRRRGGWGLARREAGCLLAVFKR